ncbi:hypothetical protein DSL64_03800 [Dyadobacter luteus]|uniref:Uncharacterized protein n=1 Tax=Dyadobacter luteus TaxID=2259619 RepID=A0A3D8YFY3_9BACT|nr:hypothetical protein [Dyadobacter luteus]REA63577.1 hypothetical protein DSL64_03800 [Dyadobacter luteus]
MATDRQFSLGLSYFDIMELSPEDLHRFLALTPREEIIDWLQWNDAGGIYNDRDSINEFGDILSSEEAMEIVKRQIVNV